MEFSSQQKAIALFIAGLIVFGFVLASFNHYKKEVKNAAGFNSSKESGILFSEKKSGIFVSIRGEIKQEGIYKISPDAALIDLIKLAGGLTAYADSGQINFLTPLNDQQEVFIPRIKIDRLKAGFAVQKININVANFEQLSQLPGLSETMVRRILKQREKFGPFQSLKDLEKIKGLTAKKLSKLEAYLCFSY